MRTIRKQAIFVLSLVILVTVAVSAQGLHWKSTMTAMGKEMHNECFVMPKLVKVVSDSGEITVLNIDKKMIYTIDPKEKQYSEMTLDEMDSLMSKMSGKTAAMSDKMKESLKNLPEAQRKMVESMMGGAAKQEPVTTKNTDEHKVIDGYNCTKYVIMQGEKELVTVWATQDIKEFAAMRKDFQEFTKRMMARIPAMAAAGGELAKLQGFAMETDYGQFKQVVSGLEKRSTPVSEFQVPAGFKKVKSKWQDGLDKAGTKQD